MAFMLSLDELGYQIRNCINCSLSQTRSNAVPGEGSTRADLVFIGEGPGFYEDRDGRPFVGQAGKLLDELLASISLKREDVYITNMVKCRPPNNRDPLPVEIESCRPFLDQQIQMIDPKVLVTLGRHSFTKFFPGEAISKARGKPRPWNQRLLYPMYHPAAALHNPKLRPLLEDDFNRLPSIVEAIVDIDASKVEPDDEIRQLGLFE
tara:strand:- start:9189 stop:9809 length:621 start_codon:yes stop_codon:yes gene_type:complete